MAVRLILGLTVIALSTLCWGGQVIAWLAPQRAARWGLAESESDVDPVFWADGRGEAVWDALTLWPMVVAGLLLTVDHRAWPYFALVGGGSYVYFTGRGIAARVVMRQQGFRIGTPRNVTIGLVALTVWAVMGAAMIAGAIIELEGG